MRGPLPHSIGSFCVTVDDRYVCPAASCVAIAHIYDVVSHEGARGLPESRLMSRYFTINGMGCAKTVWRYGALRSAPRSLCRPDHDGLVVVRRFCG